MMIILKPTPMKCNQ